MKTHQLFWSYDSEKTSDIGMFFFAILNQEVQSSFLKYLN